MTAPTLTPTAAAEQAVFRALLDCMSRPGTVAELQHTGPVEDEWAGVVAVMQTLLDHEVTFALLAEDDSAVRETILRRTGSRTAVPTDAEYLVADAGNLLAAIEQANEGDLDYPEQGATVVARCPAVGDGELTVHLSGPGIRDHSHLSLGGLTADVFKALMRKNSSFPLGIDMVLVGDNNRVSCLPRTTTVTVGEHSHSQGGN